MQLKALSWLATIGVFYVLWLFSLGAAKDSAAALHITHAGTWTGDVLFWFPVVAGYLLVALVVAWTGKVAVPAFVSLRWQGDELWPKIWMLVIMIAVSAVIIVGSITVQSETRFEGNREAAVAGEQVQRGRAALEAQKGAAEAELRTMMESRQGYLAQAASVGAAEWERTYIAQARTTNDSRLPQIERALGAARRADELRAEVRRLTGDIAAAPTDASVVQRVTAGEADQAMSGFVDWLGSIRSILLAILQDIACLLLPWIAMRTEQARARQLAMFAGPRDEADLPLGIPDLRGQDRAAPQPMDPPTTVAREEVVDAETGEVMIKVQPAKPHWRRKPKGRKVVVEERDPEADRIADEPPVLMPSDERVARDTSADVVLADSAGVLVPEPAPEPTPEPKPEPAPDPPLATVYDDRFEGVTDEHAPAVLQAHQAGADIGAVLRSLGYRVDDQRAQAAAE
jgi:hypothetical protein